MLINGFISLSYPNYHFRNKSTLPRDSFLNGLENSLLYGRKLAPSRGQKPAIHEDGKKTACLFIFYWALMDISH